MTKLLFFKKQTVISSHFLRFVPWTYIFDWSFSLLLRSSRSPDLPTQKQKQRRIQSVWQQQRVSSGDDNWFKCDRGLHGWVSAEISQYSNGVLKREMLPLSPRVYFQIHVLFPGSQCCCYATLPAGGWCKDEICSVWPKENHSVMLKDIRELMVQTARFTEEAADSSADLSTII